MKTEYKKKTIIMENCTVQKKNCSTLQLQNLCYFH